MNKLDELSQVFYEISMSIGMSLDLQRMLRDVALVTLRKLNGTALTIFMQRQDEDRYFFERAFITPRGFLKGDEYAALEQILPRQFDARESDEFYGKLPLKMAFEGGKFLHVMSLPDYGLIAFFRAHGFLPENVIYSFASLNKKLAVACQACISHEHLAELLKIRTLELDEKNKVEKALRESESRFRGLVESTSDWIWETNAEGRYTYVSPAVEKILGYTPAWLMGKTPFDLMPPEEADRIRPIFVEFARDRRSFHDLININRHRDGTERILETSGVPIIDDSGEMSGFRGIDRDVTARKKAEDQLKVSEKTYREIFNGSNDVIFIHNIDSGAIFDVNSKVSELYGYNPSELYGRTVEALSEGEPPFSVTEASEWINRAIGEGPQVFEWRARNKNGEAFWVEVSLKSAVIGGKDRLMAVVRDIRQRKAAEQELKEYREHLEELVDKRAAQIKAKNEELETFTYSVSHDLKAPLRGIDGYSRLLTEEYGDKLDEEGLRFLSNVRQSAEQMNQLIEDLLSYSRMERRDLRFIKTDIRSLVNELVFEREHEIASRSIQVKLPIADMELMSDRDSVRQILSNLLDNAIKYTREEPEARIEVHGSETAKAWKIWVKDNGIGFDPKYKERIFGIFQRLHRSEDYPGTGVGLALVAKALNRLGGRIWTESEPGKGAVFYLEIPKP